MKIGDVAKETGCSIQTIRFYERKGLLPVLKRSDTNYRIYDNESIEHLRFIKRCRSLDISMAEVKTLLDSKITPDKSCSSINALIAKHLQNVVVRIEELKDLKSSLENMSASCGEDKTIKDCGILNSLHN